MDLISQRLQGSPDNVAFIYSSGQSYNSSSGILIPIRRSQSGKCRHYITAVGIFYLPGHILRVFCRVNEPQLISEPLDHSSCHENRAFQCIGNLPVQSPGNGSNQPVFRKYRLLACIHQKEAACTISILCVSFFETSLSKKSGLLVSCCSANRNGTAQKAAVRCAVYAAGRLHLRQHLSGDIQLFQDIIIPIQSINIKKHGPGSIGIICNMRFSLSHLPDQPGLYSSKKEFSFSGPFSGPVYMVQNPFYFCS